MGHGIANKWREKPIEIRDFVIMNAPRNYELDRCQCNQNVGSPNIVLIHQSSTAHEALSALLMKSMRTIPAHPAEKAFFLSTRQADLAMGGEHPDPFSSRGRITQRHVVHTGELGWGFGLTWHLNAAGSQVDIWQEIFCRVRAIRSDLASLPR
jgi:hypothetical protein